MRHLEIVRICRFTRDYDVTKYDFSCVAEHNQHELLPEADNVADSEDSEDEWNFYRPGDSESGKVKDSSTALVNESDKCEDEKKELCSPEPREDNNLINQYPEADFGGALDIEKEEAQPSELIKPDVRFVLL